MKQILCWQCFEMVKECSEYQLLYSFWQLVCFFIFYVNGSTITSLTKKEKAATRGCKGRKNGWEQPAMRPWSPRSKHILLHGNYRTAFLMDYCNRGYLKVPISMKAGTTSLEFKLVLTHLHGEESQGQRRHQKSPVACYTITARAGKSAKDCRHLHLLWEHYIYFTIPIYGNK